MGRGQDQTVTVEGVTLRGATRRTEHARYSIRGFSDYKDLEDFCRLIEYAQRGRVIVDWHAPDEDELWPEEEENDSWAGDVPIYDETDLSGKPRYVLAQALVAAAMFDYFVTDAEEPPYLRVTTAFPQDELLADASSQTDLTLAPLT